MLVVLGSGASAAKPVPFPIGRLMMTGPIFLVGVVG